MLRCSDDLRRCSWPVQGHYESLRLWRVDFPITWAFTDGTTSLQAIEGQNIDLRVPFDDFKRIFEHAS